MRASTLFSIIGGETAREIKKGGGGLLWPIARKKNSTSLLSASFVTIFVCTLVQARKFHVHYFAAIFFLKYLTIPRSLIIWKKIIAVIHITFAVAKKKSLKKFRLVRDSNPWPVRYRCRRRSTNLTSQDVELVRIKPVKGWWWSYEYMKIIYENCGVKNYCERRSSPLIINLFRLQLVQGLYWQERTFIG